MKRQKVTIMIAALVVAIASVTTVRAQSAGSVSVTIPFEFSVGTRTLPAGDYNVRRTLQGGSVVMRIQDNNNSVRAFLPNARPVGGLDIQAESKLVFSRYGNQYCLSQIWIAGRSTGAELNKTNRERSLQREFARNGGKPERVAIAGKLD
jgi:hypothetical protein